MAENCESEAPNFALIWWFDEKKTSVIPISRVPKKKRIKDAGISLMWEDDVNKTRKKYKVKILALGCVFMFYFFFIFNQNVHTKIIIIW